MVTTTLVERTAAAIHAAQTARKPGDYAGLNAIADEASAMCAATPQEALLQACILVGEIDSDGNPERMAALAETIVGYIERTAGIDRREFGFDFYTGSGAH